MRAAYAGIIASAQAQCLYQKLNFVKCEWIPGHSHLCCYYTRRCQYNPRGDKVSKRRPKAANVPFDADVLIVSEAGSGHGIWSIVPNDQNEEKKNQPKKLQWTQHASVLATEWRRCSRQSDAEIWLLPSPFNALWASFTHTPAPLTCQSGWNMTPVAWPHPRLFPGVPIFINWTYNARVIDAVMRCG